MVKIANNVAVLGHLRDIKVSSYKVTARGNGSAQGAPVNRQNAALAEEALQAREQSGYERGLREAEERCVRQTEQLRTEWETNHRNETIRLLEDLNKNVQFQMSEVFKSLEKHVVMLAAEAAIKLTAGIPVSMDMVEAYVREAMNLVEQDTDITIAIHPDDLALLEQHQSSLLNRAGSSSVLRFRADSKVTRGGCMVETKFGELDARRETKIELLRKAVNE